jgi:CMP-N-acetylneuraminic acid synthetase
VVDVCLDALNQEEKTGCSYDLFCCLYATAPLRTTADITDTIKLIEPGVCDFALAVTTYNLPAHQALKSDEQGLLSPMWPKLIELRQEEIGKLVVDNGSTYAADVIAFRKYRSFYGPGLRGHIMPRMRSVDIDTSEDLELACLFAGRPVR